MTDDQIDLLAKEDAAALLRREGIEVCHTLFGTIHFRSERRPDGYTEDDLNEISESLEDADLIRWKKELKAHFSSKR